MKSVVIAMTNNSHKIDEYQNTFTLYGISVIQKTETEDVSLIETWLREPTQKVLFVFRETSNIFNKQTDLISQQTHLETVINKSQLALYVLKEDTLHHKTYHHSIEGYIDQTKRSETRDVFGWDDVFVNKHLQKSYDELKQMGLKTSARDLVLSDVIKEFVYYQKRIDLNFQPQQQNKSIDFSNTVSSFVGQNEYLTNPHMSKYHLDHLVANVVTSGLFFKSAKNRREKNYWLPGLNAGVPLVPKKDAIHEITFMFHDFTHFMMPDLIYDGNDSPLHQKVYVLYRMMSEAISLCIADMLFVDTLAQTGYDYDFSKRKIYPLFQALQIDLTNQFEQDLKRLLYANVQYACDGDDDYFNQLIAPDDSIYLEAYKTKYEKFFVEDYKWTVQNVQNMSLQKDNILRWLEDVKPLSDVSALPLTTVSEFIKRYNIQEASWKGLLDQLFQPIFHDIVLPFFQSTEVNQDKETKQAFIRYLTGQFGLFSKYYFLEESEVYKQRLTHYLTTHYHLLQYHHIQTVLSYFEQYIDLLKDKHLISPDDAETYKEIYTIFTPFYVFYDTKKQKTPSIKGTVNELFN